MNNTQDKNFKFIKDILLSALDLEVIAAISKGDVDNALKYFDEFPQKTIPLRVDNEVRNLKNTLIY